MNIGVLNGFEGLVAQYNVDNSKVIRFKKKMSQKVKFSVNVSSLALLQLITTEFII